MGDTHRAASSDFAAARTADAAVPLHATRHHHGWEGPNPRGFTRAPSVHAWFETDVVRVRLGQRATVSSPALVEPLHGTVDRIGMRVGKLDAIGADPAARTDARVVEVEIRLDDSAPAAGLTHLQVEIDFEG